MALHERGTAVSEHHNFSGRTRVSRTGNGTSRTAPGEHTTALAKGLGWLSVGLGVAEMIAPARVGQFIGAKKNGNLVRSLGARELANGIAILRQPQKPAWVWARVGGDLIDLALLGTAFKSGKSQRKRLLAATAAVAGVTALDIVCSRRLSAFTTPIQIKRSITIGRPADELYERWQRVFPQIMAHFAEVHIANGDRAHWLISLPAGRTVTWETQIVERRTGEFLGWRSVGEGVLAAEGSVMFSPAPRDLGTEVTLQLKFQPRAPALGETISKVLGFVPAVLAEKALRRFKSLIEAGEIPSLDHNPSARTDTKSFLGRLTR